VAFSDSETVAIATGRSGTDISYDAGKSWQTLSIQGYFSCIIIGTRVVAMGRDGKNRSRQHSYETCFLKLSTEFIGLASTNICIQLVNTIKIE